MVRSKPKLDWCLQGEYDCEPNGLSEPNGNSQQVPELWLVYPQACPQGFLLFDFNYQLWLDDSCLRT